MVEMINKNEAKLELSMIVQPSSRLFLVGWLLVLGLKECLVECATGCVKSVVILTGQVRWEYVQTSKMPKFLSHSPCQLTGWKSGSNGHYSRFGVFLSKIQNLKFRFFPVFPSDRVQPNQAKNENGSCSRLSCVNQRDFK